jgi:hypothetical protein
MEDELWKELYRTVRNLGKGRKPEGATYTDADIALTFLWAMLHDRPNAWACSRRNWPLHMRRRQLPSESTLSRRLRTDTVQELLRQTEEFWRPHAPAGQHCLWIDGKSLPIGGSSGDPDAGFGPAAGGTQAKGYKLHAISNEIQGVVAWEVEPMNVSEKTVARQLIVQVHGPGWLVGDENYDANPLYEAAAAQGLQLVAPPHCPGKSVGHRKQSPHRLKGLKLVQQRIGQRLLHGRDAAERLYGELTTPGGGLGPLPAWVRGLRRVRRWVRGKIILFHIRRYLRRKQAA